MVIRINQSLMRMSPVAFKDHRHKVIDANDLVKAKMNGSKEPSLTISTRSMIGGLRDIKMDFLIITDCNKGKPST